jgi:hypothetical protein
VFLVLRPVGAAATRPDRVVPHLTNPNEILLSGRQQVATQSQCRLIGHLHSFKRTPAVPRQAVRRATRLAGAEVTPRWRLASGAVDANVAREPPARGTQPRVTLRDGMDRESPARWPPTVCEGATAGAGRNGGTALLRLVRSLHRGPDAAGVFLFR